MKNAVIYARYSSHGQQDQSIDGQLRDCRAFAEREGFRIVGEYIDRAASAKTDARPDFQRMIKDSSKKQFQIVIVWKLDRFSRNRYDSAHYKHALKKNGVRVVSATEKISDDPEGIILEGVIESLAEYYSANLSKHVKRGQRESALKGHHVGGIPPFGFKVVNKRLVADEEKAPIIRYAFEEYARGVTKKKIMEALSVKGLLNGAGKPLTLSMLHTALRNKKYIGVYLYNGEEVKGACEAIINNDTFDKVQELLSARSHGKSGEKAKQEYLLQGKAYCGLCGTRLVGTSGTSKQGKAYHYYYCGKRKKSNTCEKLNEKKGFLEWYIVEQTMEYVLQPARIEFIASRIVARYEEEFNDRRIKDYERQVAKLDQKIKDAVHASIKAPEQSRQIYYDEMEALIAQKNDIEDELITLRVASKNRYTQEQIVAWLKVFMRGDMMDVEFQKRIIDVFVNCIYVYDDKIVIYYNVKDDASLHKQVSYIEMLDSTSEPPSVNKFGGTDGFGYQMAKPGYCYIKGKILHMNDYLIF